MSTYKKNKVQTTIKVGAYTQQPKQLSISLVEEVTPESRPATTTDIKPKEIPASKKQESKPKKAFEYDEQPAKKKASSKVKCNPKRVLLALLLTLLGIIVLVGLIFLIIYLSTLGLQTKDAFCMSNYSCLTNSSLYCLNAKCACYSNTTWNSTKSVCAVNTTTTPNITNVTVVTYPVNSVVKMFNGSAYLITSIVAYAGNAFNTIYDIAYSPITDNYYIPDNGASIVVVLDNTFNYIKKAYVSDCWYIDVYNTSIYVTTYNNLKIYRLSLDLSWQNTYLSAISVSFYNVFYSTHANMLYSCDYSNSYINYFDSSVNYIDRFYVASCVTSATLSSNTIYIGRTPSNINAYVNKVLAATYTVCNSGWVRDLLIDTTTATKYMFVSCSSDKLIYLYTVVSSSATNLYLNISTAGTPYGITIDQYGQLLVSMTSPNRVDVYKLI